MMVRAVRAARQRQTSSVEIQFGGEAFYRRGNRAIGRRRLEKKTNGATERPLAPRGVVIPPMRQREGRCSPKHRRGLRGLRSNQGGDVRCL